MKAKLSSIISSMLLCLATHAQEGNLEGVWVGHITQEPRGLDDDYHFVVDFDLKGDHAIEGTTTISIIDDSETFGLMAMKGTIHNNQIHFTEHTIVQEKIYSFAYWCMKDIYLHPVRENGKLLLKGTWTSGQCNGGTGKIVLERVPEL